MNTIEVTCPEQRRTNTRRKNLNKIWSSDEHKDNIKQFCEGKTCQWCGSGDKLTAHHPYIESYKGAYTNLELSGCIVLCNRCHFSLHRGMVLCSICKEHYYRVGGEMCKACFMRLNPEIVKAREKFIEEQEEFVRVRKRQQAFDRKLKAQKHPCKYHGIAQRCRLSSGACQYSISKALKVAVKGGCPSALPRKVKV